MTKHGAVRPRLSFEAAPFGLAMVLCFAAICGCAEDALHVNEAAKETVSSNQDLLREVDEAGAWFAARKAKPIWAKRLEHAESVQTLEGREEVPAGSFLCRGEAGDIWPQSEKSLLSKYSETSEIDDDGWRKYTPRADAEGVLAAQIDHPFTVHAKWGKLTGKKGDYLAKSRSARDAGEPEDVWIVDQKLFEATYRTISD